jgi:hypothetical protein
VSDFLTRLAGRALGIAPQVQPIITPRYSPDADVPGPGVPSAQESEIPERDSDAQPPTPSSFAPTIHSPRGPGAHHVRGPDPEDKTDASATGEDTHTATDSGATELPDEHRTEQPPTRASAEEPSPTDASDPPGTEDLNPGRSPSSAEDSPPPPIRGTRAGHEAHPESGVRPTPPILSTSRSARAQVRSISEVPAETLPSGESDVSRREDTSISAAREPGVRRAGPRSAGRTTQETQRASRTTENREPDPERPTEDPPDAYDAFERTGTPVRDHPERSERSESGELGGSSSYSTRENAFSRVEPTIRVTIGRIEVRAVSPPAPPPRRTKQPAPEMSLDDYLRARDGGTL